MRLSENASKILLKMEPPLTEEQVEEDISCSGKFCDAIILSCIFWPEFTLCDNYVFLRDVGNRLEVALRECKEKKQVEAYVNHWHIMDLFGNPFSKVNADEINYLGNVLREMWKAKLQLDFPDRHFEVEFYNENQDDLISAYITFWEV